jgi:hypothetical protein
MLTGQLRAGYTFARIRVFKLDVSVRVLSEDWSLQE